MMRSTFVALSVRAVSGLGANKVATLAVKGEAAPRMPLKNFPGVSIPVLGLGTWKSPAGKTAAAVEAAVRAGYRLIDVANDYGNEAEVGAALGKLMDEGVVKREELFIQCKLWNSNHRPKHVAADLDATLNDLKMDYIDSYLIHWPQACPSQGELALSVNGHTKAPKAQGTMLPLEEDGRYSSDNDSHYVETWEVMESLKESGRCRAIGLSNFNRRQVAEVIATAKKFKPGLLQNECHAFLQQKDLIDYCRHEGLVFQGYSPLGSRDRPWAGSGTSLAAGPPAGGVELLEQPDIVGVAKRLGKTPAQVVLRWHFQRGVCTTPKSATPSRVEANVQIFDFELGGDDMAIFDSLNVGWRHLLWPETSMHPDYPFKDELPPDYKPLAEEHSR